jgi:hypothetical protein
MVRQEATQFTFLRSRCAQAPIVILHPVGHSEQSEGPSAK